MKLNFIDGLYFLQLLVGALASQIEFKCYDIQGLCPGTPYETSCSVASKFLYQRISITSDECSVEVDFNVNDEFKHEKFIDKKCGLFNGSISKTSSWKRLKLRFTASGYLKNAKVTCFGQNTRAIEESCVISLAKKPDPPMGIQISNCSPHLITWSQPSVLRGQADQNLSYHVTINSSLDGMKQFTIDKNFMWLNEETSNKTVTYTVCVSTINCIGMSDPVCAERLVVPAVDHFKPPVVNSSILNSSSILLSWKHAKNICFDIERNFVIEYRCIKKTRIIITVESTVRLHTFRVRAQISGMTGIWSRPEYVIFVVPFPPKLIGYDISTERFETPTINLTLRVKDQSQFFGNCKVSKVKEIQISVELKLMSFSHNIMVTEEAVEYNVSFTFNRTAMQGRETLRLTMQALSDRGASPKQFHYIYIHDTGTTSCAQSAPSLSLALMAISLIINAIGCICF